MPHLTYLPTHRKRHGLSQREVASLIGVDRTTITKYEAGTQLPTLPHALSLEAAFGVPVSELLVDLYAHLTEEVVARAVELERSVAGKTDERSLKIQAFLADLMSRATNTPGV